MGTALLSVAALILCPLAWIPAPFTVFSSSAPLPFTLGVCKSSSSLPGFLCSPQTLAFGPIPITRCAMEQPVPILTAPASLETLVPPMRMGTQARSAACPAGIWQLEQCSGPRKRPRSPGSSDPGGGSGLSCSVLLPWAQLDLHLWLFFLPVSHSSRVPHTVRLLRSRCKPLLGAVL